MTNGAVKLSFTLRFFFLSVSFSLRLFRICAATSLEVTVARSRPDTRRYHRRRSYFRVGCSRILLASDAVADSQRFFRHGMFLEIIYWAEKQEEVYQVS